MNRTSRPTPARTVTALAAAVAITVSVAWSSSANTSPGGDDLPGHAHLSAPDMAAMSLTTVTVVTFGQILEVHEASGEYHGAQIVSFIPDSVLMQKDVDWNLGARTPIAPLVTGEPVLVAVDGGWGPTTGPATLAIAQPFVGQEALVEGTAGYVEVMFLDELLPAEVTDAPAAVVELIETALMLAEGGEPTDVLLQLVDEAAAFVHRLNTALPDTGPVDATGLLGSAIDAVLFASDGEDPELDTSSVNPNREIQLPITVDELQGGHDLPVALVDGEVLVENLADGVSFVALRFPGVGVAGPFAVDGGQAVITAALPAAATGVHLMIWNNQDQPLESNVDTEVEVTMTGAWVPAARVFISNPHATAPSGQLVTIEEFEAEMMERAS